MLHEAGYDIISLYSATKGMNQNISPELLGSDYSYYIENIMPNSLGEGRVRYGTSLTFDAPDSIVKAFSFKAANGTEQQVLYFNGYNVFAIVSNLRIVSTNHIRLTSVNYSLFKKDTYLSLRYSDLHGLSPVSYYEIRNVQFLGNNTIDIEVDQNSFPDHLVNFFITAPNTVNPVYIDPTHFRITVPNDFIANLFYVPGQLLNLSINAIVTQLTIAPGGVDSSIVGQITFTTVGTPVPAFIGGDVRILSYQSLTPELTTISNSVGYIKVLDLATGALLGGGNQTLTNLSVACVPRAEFFGQKLWIHNGIDPVMTWDGSVLIIYSEYVKETAVTFNRINNTNFSFVANAAFNISKYQNNNSIKLTVNGVPFTTTVTNIVQVVNLVTITTADVLPVFNGQNQLQLFYSDKPPAFSYMKAAHNRLWALGPGAVGLEYRTPAESLKFYYSYTVYTPVTPFLFFNEATKTVPSEDISATHNVSDNLEAIISVSGYLAFVGRQETQIWQGTDPLAQNSPNIFAWSSTLSVGVYHGDLIVDLPNDAYFLSQNGFLSFSTLNIAKQFATSSVPEMNKLAMEYMSSIDTNIAYRACRAFKYKGGGFCGFKVGQNSIIVSRYLTSLYWWGIFSGDFRKASSFLSSLDGGLYLCVDDKIYLYADSVSSDSPIYGDNNGNDCINFMETKYINNNKNRYANKRYSIEADYSSNVIINLGNIVNIYIRGDLRDSFIIQDLYDFPIRGDVLGTINLVDGTGLDPDQPDSDALGMRLDSPFQTLKGRLQFLSSQFSLHLVGRTKDGPFSLKRIRLFGLMER